MKKQLIRIGTFETNSSSTHSLCISAETPVYESISPNSDGNIIINADDDFGWEIEDYYDSLTKAEYMLLYADEWCGDRSEEFKNILSNVIKEQTGCNEVIFESCEGYIDHQSVEDNDYHFLFESPELLKRFIFDSNSYLHTDNDNR